MRITVILVIVGSLAFGACSDDTSGPDDYAKSVTDDQIRIDAQDATELLKSTRMVGRSLKPGNEVDWDVVLNSAGDCEGVVNLGSGAGSVMLLRVGRRTWFKGDAAYWKTVVGDRADQLIAATGDKWLQYASQPDRYGEVCSFLQRMIVLIRDGSGEVDGATEYDDQTAVKFAFESESSGARGVAYVAAGAPHRVIGIEVQGEFEASFTDFNTRLSVEPPAPRDVFDLDTLYEPA